MITKKFEFYDNKKRATYSIKVSTLSTYLISQIHN